MLNASSSSVAQFHQWLEAHRGIVAKVARSFAREPADAADLQQEMLLQLWTSRENFAAHAKPSTWIYRVCLNTALTWRRGTMRRNRHFETEANVHAIATDTSSPAEQASDQELLEKLYAAIHSLGEFDRALILLALDGLAYREMAEITGLTENHVGVALTRARQRLADLMKRNHP